MQFPLTSVIDRGRRPTYRDPDQAGPQWIGLDFDEEALFAVHYHLHSLLLPLLLAGYEVRSVILGAKSSIQADLLEIMLAPRSAKTISQESVGFTSPLEAFIGLQASNWLWGDDLVVAVALKPRSGYENAVVTLDSIDIELGDGDNKPVYVQGASLDHLLLDINSYTDIPTLAKCVGDQALIVGLAINDLLIRQWESKQNLFDVGILRIFDTGNWALDAVDVTRHEAFNRILSTLTTYSFATRETFRAILNSAIQLPQVGKRNADSVREALTTTQEESPWSIGLPGAEARTWIRDWVKEAKDWFREEAPEEKPPFKKSDHRKLSWYETVTDLFEYAYDWYLGAAMEGNVTGCIYDEDDPSKSMQGARIDLYTSKLELLTRIPCFKDYNDLTKEQEDGYIYFPATKEEDVADLEPFDVLEVQRYPDSHVDIPLLVKVRKEGVGLTNNEGWFIARWGDTMYANLVSIRQEIMTLEDEHCFGFDAIEGIPCFIRVVKEPDESGLGYFDGELEDVDSALPMGWFVPPISEISINMKSAKHMVKESSLVDLLTDWRNYNYAAKANKWKPRYPKDAEGKWYDIRKFYKAEGLSANNDIACNSFAAAIIFETWYKAFPDAVDWNKTHWYMSLMAKNEWDDVNDVFNEGLDLFSTVTGYMCITIWVKVNPDNGDEITITVNGETIKAEASVPASDSDNDLSDARAETAIFVRDALNSDNRANKIINARIESSPVGVAKKLQDEFVILESKDSATVLDVEIDISCDSGDIEKSHDIFPSIPCDVSAAENNKGWLVFQGWSKWDPKRDENEPYAANGTIGGHNVIIVSVHSPSEKVLSLESNFPNNKNLKGPGFRCMAKPDMSWSGDSGDLDHHIINIEGKDWVDPNIGINWIDKVKVKWSDMLDFYDAKPDDENSVKVARLKLYDLNWVKPML